MTREKTYLQWIHPESNLVMDAQFTEEDIFCRYIYRSYFEKIWILKLGKHCNNRLKKN